MQKKEWRRNLLVGLIVAVIFFGWWLRGFLYSNWRFHLFSRQSWLFIIKEFEAGWMLNAKSDWIFLIVLLFSVPCFLYLWHLCTKVRWRKTVKKIIKTVIHFLHSLFKKKTKKHSSKHKKKTGLILAPPPPPVSNKDIKKSTPKRPVALSTSRQSNAQGNMASIEPSEPASVFQPNMPLDTFQMPANRQPTSPVPTEPDIEADFENIPLEDIEIPVREPVVEDVPSLFENAGYQLIQNVKTSVQQIDFVAAGSDRIFVVYVDKASGDWLGEEEPFNGEAPLWFSEVDHRVSPVYELLQSVKEIEEKIAPDFSDIPVQPFMIEQKGNIINAEEMLRIWKEMQVTVSRTDVGGTEEIPTTAELIKETGPLSVAQIDTLKQLLKGE